MLVHPKKKAAQWALHSVLVVAVSAACAWGQAGTTPQPTSAPANPAVIPLTVPAGTPLKVALERDVRVRRAGQPVHGKVADPVYVFDKLVVPAGSEVTGKVVSVGAVPVKNRILAGLNADFSPPRRVRIEFDELVLPGGRRIPLQTRVSPASDGVMQLVANNARDPKKSNTVGRMVSGKAREARQQVRSDWERARLQISEPGKLHRLERFAIAELPYHPQYMDAGTEFDAELKQPLRFGQETLESGELSPMKTLPPGSIVHAMLTTPLSSATSRKGAPIEAVVTAPVFASDHKLMIPEGSSLKGVVLQVRPARRLKRNGQLRIAFHEIIPPSGAEKAVEGNLKGVEVGNSEHLKLDSEGGAVATSPRKRYVTTAISVALAATSIRSDTENGVQDTGGDAGGRAANGASGFRLIGTVVGALVRSKPLASGLGFYGAGMMIYSHFLTRGRDVVYPRDTAMVIALGNRNAPTAARAATRAARQSPGR